MYWYTRKEWEWKSTLLQMICGTIMPSEGSIKTNGRIGALLELGSGFNPDFTGMENIYLNGIIMGLKKAQISERLDNILGFADIGEYINQPVRTYSSGMVVRLAFSVITNLDTDILVIDEALAVGDAFFTQKCMRYIKKIREERCLIFVSHDAESIMSICDKAILLDNGKEVVRGKPKDVVEKYTSTLQNQMSKELQIGNSRVIKSEKGNEGKNKTKMSGNEYLSKWSDYRVDAIKQRRVDKYMSAIDLTIEKSQTKEDYGTGATITSVEFLDFERRINLSYIKGGEIVILKVQGILRRKVDSLIMGFIIKDSRGQTILGENTLDHENNIYERILEKNTKVNAEFIFTIPILKKGKYSVTVSIANGDSTSHDILQWVNDAIIIGSECSSVGAGIAGIPMHSVNMTVEE